MTKSASLLLVALAIISIALFENRSVYGVALTCTLLAILTLINTSVVWLLGRQFAQIFEYRTVRVLILFILYFAELHLLAFGAYLESGTFYFEQTPLVLNGRVTIWGYTYSGTTALLMAATASCLVSKRLAQ